MTASIPMNDAHAEEQQTNAARLPRKSARSGSAEHQAGLVGSPKERQAILAARAAADLSPEAKERCRIARDLAGRAQLVIEPDAGYVQAQEGAPPRQVAIFQYLTPYAFTFETSYREEAPYRSLADDATSRWTQFLLGAV